MSTQIKNKQNSPYKNILVYKVYRYIEIFILWLIKLIANRTTTSLFYEIFFLFAIRNDVWFQKVYYVNTLLSLSNVSHVEPIYMWIRNIAKMV